LIQIVLLWWENKALEDVRMAIRTSSVFCLYPRTERPDAEHHHHRKKAIFMTEDLGPAKTFFAYMEAVMASDLKPTHRLVLLVQAKHADAWDGELTNSFPSEKTLARETGTSVDTIQRARKALEAKGWLVKTHSGRGGSSKLSNAYDLAIPDGAISKPQDAALQSRKLPLQSRNDTQSKPQDAVTSTPSSSPSSSPPPSYGSTVVEEEVEEDENGHGDGSVSYWVGTSRNHPEGYFRRIDESTVEPKGNHALVTLTWRENSDIFGCYEYPEIRDILVGYALETGLRPPASKVAA
jgi:hypothetical protein